MLALAEAVLVEGALENAQHDRELKRHVLQEKLRKAVPRTNPRDCVGSFVNLRQNQFLASCGSSLCKATG